jgi:hypothetical protein
VSLSQPATRATSTGSNSEPPSEAEPASGDAPAPELDPEEPLDPEADPELDPELLVLDPEVLALDPDPELDPPSALSPAAPPDPDEEEQAATTKAIAVPTVTWARRRMEWSVPPGTPYRPGDQGLARRVVPDMPYTLELTQ